MSQYELGIKITADGRVLVAEAGRSTAAVEQIGEAGKRAGAEAEQGLGQAEAATSRLGNALRQQTAAAINSTAQQAKRLGTDGASSFAQAEAAAARLTATTRQATQSSAELSQKMRQVAPQFTDIVTSLVGGQSPFQVMIQQGGQLKDVFGGVGAAAKATGAYVLSLVTPLTVAAGAVAVLGAAAYQGAKESAGYTQAIIQTGNAAGTTVNQLSSMAARIGEARGLTRGMAADVLAELTSTGQVGADMLEAITRTTLQLQRVGGPAVADTVKQFAELGRSPVKASRELAEQTNYLSAATFGQIKALEDQGRASDAARLAQQAYADALNDRIPKLEKNLGTLERAWDGVRSAAGKAWDWMKGIGREETLDDQIARVKNHLETAKSYGNTDSVAAGEENLRLLNRKKLAEADAAAATAKANEQERARIKWLVDGDQYLDRAGKLERELTRARNEGAAAGLAQGEIDKRLADIREKYRDKQGEADAKKAAREAAEEQRKLNDLLAEGGGESAQYAEKLALLQKYLLAHGATIKEGTPEMERYRAAVVHLIETETKAGKTFAEQREAAKKFAIDLDNLKVAHAGQIKTIDAETDSIGKSAEARKIAVEMVRLDQEAKAKLAELTGKLSEQDQKQAEQQINAERDKQKALVATAMARQQAVAGAYELEQQNRRFAAESIVDEQARAVAILNIDAEMWQQRIALAAEGSDERKRLEAAFQQWYANQLSKPAQENMRRIVDSMDRTFHDGFTHMLEQGKADWDAFGRSLANSFKTLVADEIYRMTIRPMVSSVVGAVIGGANGTAQAGSAGGSNAGGGIGSALNMIGTARTAWTAYTSGFSGMATGAGGLINNAGYYMGSESMMQFGNGMSLYGSGGAATASTAGGATATGAEFAAAMPYVALVVGAILAADGMQKSGWGPDNNKDTFKKDMFWGGGLPWMTAIKWGGDIFKERLFGVSRTVNADAAGLVGNIGLTGFSGDMWQDYSQKGGVFHGDKRWTENTAIDAELQSAIDNTIKATVAGIKAIGGQMGIEAESALKGYSKAINLQLTDNGSWDEASKKIQDALARVEDDLAQRLVPNIKDFARVGEDASDTLGRLSQEMTATDVILQAMGRNATDAFGAAGLASITARERLINLAGGLDALASKTQSYYQHYYTDGERLQRAAAQAQEQVNKAFAEMGIAVPKNAAEFRALVEAQQLGTEAGAKLTSQLLDIEGAFYLTQQAAESLATSTHEAGQAFISTLTSIAQQISQVTSFKAGVSDAQFGIRSKQPGFDSVGYWANQASAIRTQLSGATSLDDRLALGSKLQSAILSRYQAEQSAIQTNRDAIKASFDEQRQAAMGALSAQKDAIQAQASAAKAWNDSLLRIRDFAKGLATSDLTGASPESRYKAAASQYHDLLTKTRNGDAEAASQLQNAAQTYLQLNKDWYGGNAAGSAVSSQVQAELAALGAQAQDQAAIDARYQQATYDYQQRSLALDAQWQAKWTDISTGWQQEDTALAEKTLAELDDLQAQADAWNAELRTYQATTALEAVKTNTWLEQVANNTEELKKLPTEVASALTAAMATIKAGLDAVASIQAAVGQQLVANAEQQSDSLVQIERINRQAAL